MKQCYDFRHVRTMLGRVSRDAQRMFFPVRKQKKKSQSNKCKILKYFRTSGSTQEYLLSTQTCQVQNKLNNLVKSIYLLKHAKCKILKSIYLLKNAKCKILKSIYLLKLRNIRILTSIYLLKNTCD